MSGDLTSWVGARLDLDSKLSDDAKLLILAALDGEAGLADMAGYTPPPRATEATEKHEPVGAFLEQIKVRGFRGIGPESELNLDPFPSLTVISGRNGSGKSSFAEALEVALTGTTYRWKKRATQWKERWRNIHDGDSTRIDVTLAEEGVGRTALTAEWPTGAELDGRVASVQRRGQRKQAGTESLGWDGPLEAFRPLLTYEELGAILAAEPKVLYDALSTVLGLGGLSDAVKALDGHRKEMAAPEVTVRDLKKRLLEALAGLDDDRATQAAVLVKARSLDVDGMRRLATGSSPVGGLGGRLRALLQLGIPSAEDCRSAAADLRGAVGGLSDVGDRVGDALQRHHQLIRAAIALHDHDGDQACPVCATGTLDAARVARLRAELDDDKDRIAELDVARGRLDRARGAAKALINPPPIGLGGDHLPTQLVALVEAVTRAWTSWAATPGDDLDLSEHLATHAEPVRDALADMQITARQVLDNLDEAWATAATQLAAYADAAEAWEKAKPEADDAKAAHKWLKDNEIVLKNERVKPIADEAKRIWAALRQESNVEIAGLTLESSNTRRRVTIAAEVDGEEAGALAVMSQGELHSLALALFLPRATMPQSPFRFVILDDPVQAMDPAKVEGLVTVLLGIAETRQVIVFSHDDRFASAVRRAPGNVPVKVLEVVREANSEVTVTVVHSPAKRYLSDAFGLVKDTGLPEETLRRVLPGLLRMALEAQARDAYFARELSNGVSPAAVEKVWEEARRTRQRLELAISPSLSIDTWFARERYRRPAFNSANEIHGGLKRNPMDACREVEKTVADLRAGAR